MKTKQKLSTSSLSKMALLVALMCVSAYIVIPLPFSPVPLTAQTLMVNLIAFLLTPVEAVITIVVYLLVGLVGLPVFSGGMGGPAKLFGPTGGYLLAWVLAVPLMSLLKGKQYHFVRYTMTAMFVGMTITYGVGSLYMHLTAGMSWEAVLVAAVIPFVPLDLVKCVIATWLAKPIRAVLFRASTV